MRYIQTPVYKFEELSETAKDHAKTVLNTFEFGAESVLEDLKTIAEILGFYDVTPRYSGFWSQGDGASFTGRYKYAKGAPKAIKEYSNDAELLRIAEGLQALQRVNFYHLRATLSLGSRSNHYCHENTINFEVYDSETEYRALGGALEDLPELARDLMRWLYSALEREYNYCNSDEYIKDHCESNGYEFDVNGNLI